MVSDGWLITTGGCDEQRMRFERPGFDILSKPLVVELTGSGVRLRNDRGSILLERRAAPRVAGTRWRIVSINGVPPPRPAIGTVGFTATEYRANFGCNDMQGGYRLEGSRFMTQLSRMSEKGCELVPPTTPSLMDYEDWGAAIMWGGTLTVSIPADGQLRLENAKGVILLQRSR